MGKRSVDDEYTQYYADKLNDAQEFQDFVADALFELAGIAVVGYSSRKWQFNCGENRQGIEIKYDMLRKETGNLWIEVKEKSHPENDDYVPSGIYRNDNSWLYAIGDYSVLYVFSKKTLKSLHTWERKNKRQFPERENKTKTSIGFLMNQEQSEKYADKVLPVGKYPHLLLKHCASA